MNGRVYDPALGRFLSVDPIFQFPSNAQSLNPYTYVLNSPLSMTDPTGLACDLEKGDACAEQEFSERDSNQDGKVSRSEVTGAKSYSSVEIEGMGSVSAGGGGNGAKTDQNAAKDTSPAPDTVGSAATRTTQGAGETPNAGAGATGQTTSGGTADAGSNKAPPAEDKSRPVPMSNPSVYWETGEGKNKRGHAAQYNGTTGKLMGSVTFMYSRMTKDIVRPRDWASVEKLLRFSNYAGNRMVNVRSAFRDAATQKMLIDSGNPHAAGVSSHTQSDAFDIDVEGMSGWRTSELAKQSGYFRRVNYYTGDYGEGYTHVDDWSTKRSGFFVDWAYQGSLRD